MPLLIDTIPGYREAVEREQSERDLAFVEAVPQFICGVEVEPLTVQRHILLESCRNPLVCGGKSIPHPLDVALFLWTVSPQYTAALRVRGFIEPFCRPLATWIFNRTRHRFARRVRKLDYWKAVQGCAAYLSAAWQDGDGRKERSGDYWHPSYYSNAAALVCDLSKAGLHFTEREFLNMPIKRLLQYRRRIMHLNNPNAIFFNPSDRVRRENYGRRN